MKQIKMLLVAIACSALFFAGASTVSAQTLPMDNTWFEIAASVKGEGFDLDDGSVDKLSIKRTAYLYIADSAGDYACTIFSETADGVWNGTGGGSIPADFITDDDTFMYMQPWVIYEPPGPTLINLYLTGKFKVKLNKDDSLKKATFTFLNAVIVPGPFDPVTNEWAFGKVKVKAKMIDVDDLPAGVPTP